MRTSRVVVGSIAFTMVFATELFAHSVDKRFGDFYGGMLHPLTALEHLLPLLGLGLLAGQQGPKTARWCVLLFGASVVIGAIIAGPAEPGSGVVWFNRLSFILVGLGVALAPRIPMGVLMSFAIMLGLTHGFENTAGLSEAVAQRLFIPGLVVASATMVVVTAAVVVTFKLHWQQIAARVVGSWIAAIGILMLGLM